MQTGMLSNNRREKLIEVLKKYFELNYIGRLADSGVIMSLEKRNEIDEGRSPELYIDAKTFDSTPHNSWELKIYFHKVPILESFEPLIEDLKILGKDIKLKAYDAHGKSWYLLGRDNEILSTNIKPYDYIPTLNAPKQGSNQLYV